MGELISFEEFMAEALYGPDGFYMTGGRAGRRGDFITSPEVGPLFGTVVARFLDAEWYRLGRPSRFSFVDVGAGPGALVRSVLAARPRCLTALSCVAVELSAAQRALHPDGVESRADLPTEPIVGVVFANELLDNLPFRLAVYDAGWREAFADAHDDGRWVEHLGSSLEPVPACLPPQASHGARAPLIERAAAFVDVARERLHAGTLVCIDYAVPSTAALALRPWREWLRTYRGHERGGHYLFGKTTQDITTEVPVDQLPQPSAIRTQEQWLRLYGIDDLVAEGKVHWEAHASSPDLSSLRMRSRVSEAEALLDPMGLGGFSVIEWRVVAG